jgi:hypothetical protein
VVFVDYTQGRERLTCSGVLVNNQSFYFVLTAGHCLREAQDVRVRFFTGLRGS